MFTAGLAILAVAFHICQIQSSELPCTTPECVRAAGDIISAMDLTADPCEDFYRYACGSFEFHQSIPAGESKLQQFNIVDTIISKKMKAMLDHLNPQINRNDYTNLPVIEKLGIFFQTCQTVSDRQSEVLKSVTEMVSDIGGFKIINDRTGMGDNDGWSVNKVLEKFSDYSMTGFFRMSVEQDEKNSSINVVKFGQDGLGLGGFSADYYLNKSINHDPTLSAYLKMLKQFAKIVAGPKAREINVLDVVRFEQRLAAVHLSQTELQDSFKSYKMVNISWLQANMTFLNWKSYITHVFTDVDIEIDDNEPVVIYGLEYFLKLDHLIRIYQRSYRGRRALQNYLVFLAIGKYAEFLGGDLEAADHEFKTVFEGRAGAFDRWRICLEVSNQIIGFQLGAMYSEQNLPEHEKQVAEDIITATLDEFRRRLVGAKWMDNVTVAAALKKFDTINLNVGYPEWLLNHTYLEEMYSDLEITSDYTTNQFHAYRFTRRRQLKASRRI